MKKARKRSKTMSEQALSRVGGGWGYDWMGGWQNDNPYAIPSGWQDMATPATGSSGGGGGGGLCKGPFAEIKWPDICGSGALLY